VTAARERLDLGGQWAAAEADDELRRSFPRPDYDDSGWATLTVPGHWRSQATFASSDGPLLYRRRFEAAQPVGRERTWLVMDGAFYQSDVWLDGSYLGDTEGYFFPHIFDISAALEARTEHVLAVEVGCERSSRPSGKRALIGVWSDETCIDPAYNPGGIWAPVGVVTTGPVRIESLWLACREASAERALLELSAHLDSSETLTASLGTSIVDSGAGQVAGDERRQALAKGRNRVRWRLEVPNPRLWWPVGLGDQPLYQLVVNVDVGAEVSDSRECTTGLRQVRANDFRFRVNGEDVFLKGANVLPTQRDLAAASPEGVARDVHLAREAGLNLLRAHAHIARPELYRAADELGVLVWQDMPLHGAYRGVRRQAVRQAAKAVELLGHHPSVVLWCAHNEPFPSGPVGQGWRPGRSLRRLAGQAFPNPNRSLLDQSIKRAFERADGSRPVVAGSGVLPHLARATASHLYFGWYHGTKRDLVRAARMWPGATRFVSELGAQAVASSPTPGFSAEKWPDLPWAEVSQHFCLQKGVLDWRLPPRQYPSFEAWRDATQAYQGDLVRCQVEALRKLRYTPTGGFAVHFLSDAQPGISHSLVDWERAPKQGFYDLRAACAPVLPVADWPAGRYDPGAAVSFAVHVINDLREALEGAVLEARLSWPGGGRRWRFGGDVPGPGVFFVGNLSTSLPLGVLLHDAVALGEGDADGNCWPLVLELDLRWGSPERSSLNHYRSAITPKGARLRR